MNAMLDAAKNSGYAVGAFNILDYSSMKAVVACAEELKAPAIIQTSVTTVRYWGFRPLVEWYLELAKGSPVPLALHLDHCRSLEVIERCIEAGWTSVMIDASSTPFENNRTLTGQVLEMAGPKGVSVEAELGQIVGVEEDIKVVQGYVTGADEAVRFCDGLDMSVFAPAVGTAHGLYKGEPRIAFDAIEEIARRTGLPIALHGGTGLSDDVFRRAISLGCAKVNISTMLKHTLIDSFTAYVSSHQNEYNPLRILQHQFEKLKTVIKGYIKLFGGEGKTE